MSKIIVLLVFLCYYFYGDNMKKNNKKNKFSVFLSKLKEFANKEKWILITFFISLITVSFIYILQKIAPFGENSMLDVDFFHQYGPLLNELYDRVKQGENLLFSFNTGGGIPFYKNFLNYLSSPFNILLLLFKKENIIVGYSVIIGLKVVFAATNMSIFLKKVFKKDSFLLPVFSILYSLSGYFCAYYWNIMWLDGMVFLPIIMYGIVKLVDSNKPILYIVSLAIMLFANYFIGYMICIFSILFYISYMFIRKNLKIKVILKKTLLFGISYILAGGIVSFALIPLFKSLSSISATGDSFSSFAFNFNVFDYIFNHVTGVKRTVFASDVLPLPNIYSGLITLVGLILLFLNKKINLRVKILSGLCLLFFFFSFNINCVDFIWHAFHVPNDLPYRYSFLYVFCLIVIGYYSLIKSDSVGIIKISISFAIILFIILIAEKVNFANFNTDTALFCMVVLLVYYVLFLLYRYKKVPIYVTSSLFIILCSAEVIFGINDNWNIDHNIPTFMSDYSSYQSLIKYAKKIDNDLYRMEKTSYVTLNDGAWYDYYGISTFSSMAYEKVSMLQRNLGLGGNTINSFYYNHYNSPVYNSMFNIKYIMGSSINNKLYNNVMSNDIATLNRYNYSTSLAYSSSIGLKYFSSTEYMPFYNQSNFVKLLTDTDDEVFTGINVKETSNIVVDDESFSTDSNGEFYYSLKDTLDNSFTLTLDNKNKDNIYLYVGGSEVSSFAVEGVNYNITSDEFYIVDVGVFDQDYVNVRVNLKSSNSGNLKFYAYNLNHDVFNNFYNYINSHELKVTSYSETDIKGTINVPKDNFVFTTIAYDEGWSVYIDNKKVNTFSVADSFLAFDSSSGDHDIRLVYYPKGMRLGLIISLISICLTFILNTFLKRNEKTIKKDKLSV